MAPVANRRSCPLPHGPRWPIIVECGPVTRLPSLLVLTFSGSRRTLCDGLSRRQLLQVGGLEILGLSAQHQTLGNINAVAPAFGRAKSCILIFPYGSPSSHETFDPKPSAPAEVQGEMKAISSAVPGLSVCERIPNMATVMDKVTVIRSMTHPYPLHGLAYAVTGIPTYTPALETRARDKQHWPFIGSIVDFVDAAAGRGNAELPRNIGLPWLVNSKTDNPAVNAGPFAAFLGAAHDPIWTDFDGPGLHIAPKNTVAQTERFRNPFGGTLSRGRFHLSSAAERPADISIKRLGLRGSLLAQFDRQRPQLANQPRVAGYDRQREQALTLLTSNQMRHALDISREPQRVREAYGMHLFGQSCLAARRIIEAGGRFVSVFWDCFGQFANGAWDTHQYHYPRMKELLLPGFDTAFPTLLNDLQQRGLLDETLVIWMSEHGRTPTLVPNRPGGGRDHWSRAYSALVAGAGTAPGKVVGKTTPDGGDVLDTPVSPKDILATTFHLLGIDPHLNLIDPLQRPHPIAGSGVVRPELLA